MTGYQSKKAVALDKLEQWGCEAFNDWWDSDYDDRNNPYERDSFAYWAWAGWQAALAQPAQEPVCPECKAGVLYECVACSSNNYPPQQYANPMAWAALKLAQEPVCPECKAGVLYECVTCSSNNYPPKPAQKPVAWAVYDKRGGSKSLHWHEQHSPDGDATMFDAVPLVLQRPWVGLMDEQIADYLGDEYHAMTESDLRFFRLGEAAAKEKNNGN